tara:strand:- start:131 stop:424 length:294 start_codon:yes stop_codon:yes gene_type:complete
MPLDKYGKPVLYKPFRGRSTPSTKKFSVYVKADNKKGFKILHFGQKGADDFRSGTATQQQRKSYLARAKGIKNKKGELTWKDKNTANFWSVSWLWDG